MPAKRKRKSQRQDNRKQRSSKTLVVVPEVVEDDDAEIQSLVPLLPELEGDDKWLKESERLWERYWTSSVCQAIEGADLTIAEQWITAHDEWKRATRAVRKERTVDGSMGQPVMNPLAAYAKTQADEMRKCGASLGIGPKERVALGLEVGKGKLTAAQLNKMTQPPEVPRDANADAATRDILAEFDLG